MLFQYQSQVLPLQSVTAQALPSFDWYQSQPQPDRLIHSLIVSGTVEPFHQVILQSLPSFDWFQSTPQPNRSVRLPIIDEIVKPLQPIVLQALPSFSWFQSQSQPSRFFHPPIIDGSVELSLSIVLPSFDWFQSQPQPTSILPRQTGYSVVPVSTASETVSVDRWIPTYIQSSRKIVYAKGTSTVNPLQPITILAQPSLEWNQSQPYPSRIPPSFA